MNFLNFSIDKIGYFGVFIGMFFESTIVPIPSELVMVPAGIAANKGEMSLSMIIFFGVLGNVCGAIASYYISLNLGRNLIFNKGKLPFISKNNLKKIDAFFAKYGNGSVFIGRLLPGFRHFISIPAGIAKMNIWKFTFYTSFGSAIWTSILAFVGFFVGENHDRILHYIDKMIIAILLATIITFACYYILRKPVLK